MNDTHIENSTREAIAHALVHRRSDVIRLLQNAGAPVAGGISDNDLIGATLRAVKSSAPFRRDLTSLLKEMASETETTFGGNAKTELGTRERTTTISSIGTFNPVSVTPNTGIVSGVNIAPSTPITTTQNSSGGFLGGFFDKDKLDTIFNTGMGILSTKLAASANKGSEERALAIEQEKTKQALLAAQAGAAGGSGNGSGNGSGMSTGVKIAIGVGAAALLGTVIYLIVKAK